MYNQTAADKRFLVFTCSILESNEGLGFGELTFSSDDILGALKWITNSACDYESFNVYDRIEGKEIDLSVFISSDYKAIFNLSYAEANKLPENIEANFWRRKFQEYTNFVDEYVNACKELEQIKLNK